MQQAGNYGLWTSLGPTTDSSSYAALHSHPKLSRLTVSSYNASPFQVTVQPAVFDLTRCDATGAGLTIATAGVSASVSVTLRDRFGNYQPSVSAGSITLILNYGTAAVEVTDCFGGSCPSTMAGPFITSPPFVAFPSAKPVYILSYITTTSGLYVPTPPSPPLVYKCFDM